MTLFPSGVWKSATNEQSQIIPHHATPHHATPQYTSQPCCQCIPETNSCIVLQSSLSSFFTFFSLINLRVRNFFDFVLCSSFDFLSLASSFFLHRLHSFHLLLDQFGSLKLLRLRLVLFFRLLVARFFIHSSLVLSNGFVSLLIKLLQPVHLNLVVNRRGRRSNRDHLRSGSSP